MRKPREWIIGASAGCDVVIEEQTVSGRHCRLLWQEGGYQLEDLASTNGTFVNDVQLTKPQTVTRNDRITLGKSVPFPWSRIQQPVVYATTAPAGQTRTPANAVDVQVDPRWQHLPMVLSAVALLSVLILGVVLLRGRGTGADTPAASTAATSATSTSAIDPKPAATPGKVDTGERRPAALTQESEKTSKTEVSATPQPPPAPKIQPDDPANSLYCLTIGDLRDTQRYRLGTACAIDTHRLLSSASIVSAAEQLAERFPKLAAVSADGTATLQVRSKVVHPEFAKAAAEVISVKQRLAVLQGVDSSTNGARQGGTSVEDGTKVTAEFAQLHERGLELAKTMLTYDIAVLEVSEALPHTLAVDASTRPSEGVPLTLLGLPADNESLFLDRTAPLVIGREVAQVSEPAAGGKDESRLYAKCPAEQVRLNWAGSPLVNNKNQVIAVYCRPSPADDLLAPPVKERLEAAWADASRGL